MCRLYHMYLKCINIIILNKCDWFSHVRINACLNITFDTDEVISVLQKPTVNKLSWNSTTCVHSTAFFFFLIFYLLTFRCITATCWVVAWVSYNLIHSSSLILLNSSEFNWLLQILHWKFKKIHHVNSLWNVFKVGNQFI